MFAIVKILASVALVGALTLLLSNYNGFFVSYADDPRWEDPAPAADAAGAVAASPGAEVFSQRCAVCHGAEGKGVAGAFPPLAGSELANGDPEKPIKIILHGFAGKIVRAGAEYNGVMSAHKDLLSDEQIAQVLSYVRTNWGNAGGEVAVDAVTAVRTATEGRAAAYTETEL